jgi:predicted AlkP superfamily pyrophosphatase or phosphodiesterase
MKQYCIVAGLVIFSLIAHAQKKSKSEVTIARPRLVVGIVVDQMRWDFLYRFAARYSDKGFKKLLNEGHTCENTFIPYTPTYTAPGHTCVYTGTVPAIHGIVSNYWYSRALKKSWYCTDDTTVSTVGSTSDAGKMSPVNMWTTTITDELKLATNFQAKVIGIALKDRGAILPAGHSANAAYWFDNANGGFISSTYYIKELPLWVKKFNDRKLPDQYLQQNWNTLYPVDTYSQSTPEGKGYEENLPGEDNTFPHITAGITKDRYNTVRYTPYGNTLTVEMAKAALDGEKLGQGLNTDFLAVSFSSPDYIGHTFGPNSVEAEDAYLRLDNDIASFLEYLDTRIGKGAYTVFLTSDHGAAHNRVFLNENKIIAGHLEEKDIKATLNELVEKRFNIKKGIETITNYQVYLSKNVATEDQPKVKQAIIERLLEFSAIANAVDLTALNTTPVPARIKEMLVNGYNQKISGDIQYMYKPQHLEGWDKGTSHGSWNPYDSHIPLLWYGWGIKKGKTNRETYMTDIAATIAALLHIQMPSGCIGRVIEEVLN